MSHTSPPGMQLYAMWILPNKKSKLTPRTLQQQQLFLQMELRKKECRLRYHTRTMQGGNDSPPPLPEVFFSELSFPLLLRGASKCSAFVQTVSSRAHFVVPGRKRAWPEGRRVNTSVQPFSPHLLSSGPPSLGSASDAFVACVFIADGCKYNCHPSCCYTRLAPVASTSAAGWAQRILFLFYRLQVPLKEKSRATFLLGERADVNWHAILVSNVLGAEKNSHHSSREVPCFLFPPCVVILNVLPTSHCSRPLLARVAPACSCGVHFVKCEVTVIFISIWAPGKSLCELVYCRQ